MNISTCHILHPSLVLIDAVVLINRTPLLHAIGGSDARAS